MPRCLDLGARSLLNSCLAVFVVTTAASTNTNVGVQPRHQTADNAIEVLDQIHGKTFAFLDKHTKKPYLVNSEVSCFTIQLLHSAEEKEHKVMLWLHYTTLSDRLTHVDTISFAVKPELQMTPGNKLRFNFDGSSKNDLTVKEAEFIHRPNSCYRLKIFKDGGCAFLALLTSSDNSGSDNCLQSHELETCTSEIYHAAESKKCLEYTLVTEEPKKQDAETSTLSPIKNNPRLETDPELQQYQDFIKGLLFGSLVLVYSSLQGDDFRLCMITYRPNKPPGPDGNLYILTSGLEGKRAMVQTFNPYTLSGYNETYRTAARIYRNGEFYETKVIFTDKKQCIILRTLGYQNLCELFTGGRYTNGILNSICFFIYSVYCKEPARRFTSLDECWPPASK